MYPNNIGGLNFLQLKSKLFIFNKYLIKIVIVETSLWLLRIYLRPGRMLELQEKNST